MREIDSQPSEHLIPDLLIDAISDCIPKIGTDEFIGQFLDIVRLIGAGQTTAYAYELAKVKCLLSSNFMSDDKGGTLAATYLDGWFREDPLYEQSMDMVINECFVEQLDDLLPSMNPLYRAIFFDAPGFKTKVAVLVAQGSLRMVLNLYFADDISDNAAHSRGRVTAGMYRLIGRASATHFLRLEMPDFPLPLTVLSERERQVCIGMLAGKKAEIIADEIGVGSSSVVTYRHRAYQKLGISSRGQLFSICRSWTGTGASSAA